MKNPWLKKKYTNNFPGDDANSLMQMAGYGDCNLDFYYDSQFVQNENTNVTSGLRCKYLLEHTPVMQMTATFTVYVGNIAVQIGYDKNGSLCFDKIGNPPAFVVEGDMNYTTGEVCVRFNKPVENAKLVISYEYNLETQITDQ